MGQNYEVPAMSKIYELQAASQIRMTEDDYKNNGRLQRQAVCLHQKSLAAEEERERKKAQCDLLAIDESGNIQVQTMNLRITAYARKVTNFSQPQIIVFERLGKEEPKINVFFCCIQNEDRFVMLDSRRCGNPTYVLKKWASIGAEIFAPTLATKKQYAMQLMALLLQARDTPSKLPDRRGWYKNENGEIHFFVGQWTWEEAMECTK